MKFRKKLKQYGNGIVIQITKEECLANNFYSGSFVDVEIIKVKSDEK